MDDLSLGLAERLQEIETYLDLLEALEKQVQKGPPKLGESGEVVTPQQQRILYSSVYIQLYSLVESTISRCVDASFTFICSQNIRPNDLCPELRQEWVRYVARTDADLNYEKRLQSTMNLCDHVIQSLPVSNFMVEKGGGGNWDDEEIYKFGNRLGLTLKTKISIDAQKAVKKHVRNEMGTLALIKDYRNKLSHGNLSFAECGDSTTTVQELRELTAQVAIYMREVVDCFQQFMDDHEFLMPEKRDKEAEKL